MPARWVVLGALLSGAPGPGAPEPDRAPSMELLEYLGTFRDADGKFMDPLLFHEVDEAVPAPVTQPQPRQEDESARTRGTSPDEEDPDS